MLVTINGEQRDVAASSVAALMSELDCTGGHYAVAINYDVVPRGKWDETPLAAGDEIEILTPRQGG
ncbi:sulfur carrier protein ThiS [Rhodopseudomonas pseudopalustris]|uniref:Sulfur carrier protein n=1 Tax=Rhodopseudomonas pseudopalustris TaxID=1513892 RepID=A0A1H8QH60_9BRAD|nr:sulfur carrier protein ThiS [Rhodopseudomonas pseudopalustris]MBB1091348.1 sulfur carrier protein ThiS [Rhodopseudomonas palustris]SEO53570.1 sulfur carrier protein [Rhodopseudomonas pseudopalustris]